MPHHKFYIIEMSPSIVLGFTFLKQRSITVDFAALRLKFKYKNTEYELLGHTTK